MKNFEFDLKENIIYKGMNYMIIGRAQFFGLPKNRYLLQRWDEEIGLDFSIGTWTEEDEITKV